MAESSKKNSRKSKLVPREGIELEDVMATTSAELEKAVLFIPSSEPSTSLLPKIKSTIDEDSFERNLPTPVEFSVQVQVESCSDEEQIESSIYLDDEEKYLREQKKLHAKLPKKEIVIYSDTILEELNKTAKKIKTIADKQLDIFIRNILHRNSMTFELDYYESILQEVLSQWRVWVCMSKTRSYVLAYKCNICHQGWWNLQPFEDHIRMHKHEDINVRLETFHQDCVITATAATETWFENMCLVRIEGDCPRCLKPYENHTKMKRSSLYYICDGCGDRFPTCQNLFSHEGRCIKYQRIVYSNLNVIPDDEQWKCQVCYANCLTEERYTQHLLGSHDVRSDEPVNTTLAKDCNLCGNKYFIYNLHVCPKRSDNFKCSHCFRKFQNKFMLDQHENHHNSSCYCPVCNKYLKKQCMLYEHLVRHSKYYAIAFKCQDCSDNVIVPTYMLAYHKSNYHNRKHDGRNIFLTMIVPKQCLSLKFCEPVKVADMINTNKKNIRAAPKTDTKEEVLAALTSIVQGRKEYIDLKERELKLVEEQEQHDTVVKNISKELANKFHKRANNLQGSVKHEIEVDLTADSPENDINDTNSDDKSDHDGCLVIEDDLAIDDDDIGETESSVNALLNQFKIKKEIDTEEPDMMHYMELDNIKRENCEQNEDVKIENGFQHSTDIKIKPELLCNETIETDSSFMVSVNETTEPDSSCTVSVKQEAVDDEVIIIEDSQESEVTEIKVPENEQTNDVKDNDHIFKTDIVMKQEPLDNNDIDSNKIEVTEDEASSIENNSEKVDEEEKNIKSLIENNSKEVNEQEIEIKVEKEDYQEFDVDIENDIEREQKACLEELSKVFKAAKSAKKVKLSNICVDEIKVKDEPMEIGTDDFEHDVIVNKFKQDFEVTVVSETLNSSAETCSNGTNSVDPAHLEPEVNISTDNNTETSTSEQHKKKRRLYSCNKCDFTGEHKMYMAHIQETCPRMSKNSRSYKKEIWTDIRCKKCDRKFLTLRKYLTHLSKVHYLRHNTCPQCFKEFPNLSSTLIHFTMHIKKGFVKCQVLKDLSYYSSQLSGVHQCKVCNEEVFYKNFFTHWESHFEIQFEEDEEKNLVIDETAADKNADGEQRCDNALLDLDIKNILEQLQLTADDRELNEKRCCACTRLFVRRNDCKRHLIEHLLKAAYEAPGQGLACQLCKKTFEKPDKYKVHMRQHGSLPVFKCEMCNKCFSDSSNFAKHKKVHNMQALQCDECKRKFQSKTQLEKHMELHRTTKPMACEVCGRVFPLPSAYKKHVRAHHNGTPSGLSYCRICRKREPTRRDLWEHMWNVHRLRRSQADCLICDKSFRKYVEVRAHMRVAHKLNTKVTIKTLQKIQALSATERAEKIRELLSTTVTVDNPSTEETFVIYE